MRPPADTGPGIVCLTFDNLGEAADLGAGTWPQDAPLGEHFTVGVVHRLLDSLERSRLRATFFVEAFNTELYPHVLREIAGRGHEVAVHGWQHEQWRELPAARERELLVRCTGALRDLELDPVGFRPPGGQVTDRTPELLAELGYRYYSPAGRRAGVSGSLAVIPFEWRSVDALFLAPVFAGLREHYGLTPAPLPPEELRAPFEAALRASAASHDQRTLLFHPMLLDGEAQYGTLEAVLADAAGLTAASDLQCLTMREFADRMLAAPDRFAEPVVDRCSWVSASAD